MRIANCNVVRKLPLRSVFFQLAEISALELSLDRRIEGVKEGRVQVREQVCRLLVSVSVRVCARAL